MLLQNSNVILLNNLHSYNFYFSVTGIYLSIVHFPLFFNNLFQEKIKLENKEKVKLIRKCPYYEEWPTLSIRELVALIKWKKFPPGHGEFNAILDHFLYLTYYWN